MKLFSVCPTCHEFDPQPYDGSRLWGDFDKCSKCGSVKDVWTESGVRNEQARRIRSAHAAVSALDGGR